MNLRKIYYSVSPNMRFLLRRIYYMPIDLVETMSGKREKYEPPKGAIYVGSGDFIEQGKHQLKLLKKYIFLKPTDRVLDIGSGIGRTAIPLTQFLSSEGRYEGFDVVEKGVKWCNSKIKKDFPNFNFVYVPLNNDLYNTNKAKASVFKFPYPDEQFDKIFLFSVFTHMQIEEIENYLREIRRVLKPDGLCLATFFLYDLQMEQIIASRTTFGFPVQKEGYRLMSEEVKSANLAIEDNKLEQMLSSVELRKINKIDGYWKDAQLKTDHNDFQDIIVLAKAAS